MPEARPSSGRLPTVVGVVACVCSLALVLTTQGHGAEDVVVELPPPLTQPLSQTHLQTIRVRSSAVPSSPSPLLRDSDLDGPVAEVREVAPSEGAAVRCLPAGQGDSYGWQCNTEEGHVKLLVRVIVRRTPDAAGGNDDCSRQETSYDDALELSAVSDRAMVTPYDIRRLSTHPSGRAAVYVASVDVYESATYTIVASVRFFCGEQLATWRSPGPGPISRAPKPYPPWVLRWAPLKLSLDLAARWTSEKCVVDSSLTWQDRGLNQTDAMLQQARTKRSAVTVTVKLVQAPPSLPSCAALKDQQPATTTQPGRWVNLRRLFGDVTLTVCRPPYCTGNFHAVLVKGDAEAEAQPPFEQGWVYVPANCMLEYPASTTAAWSNFDGKVLILLGDSTTSDTVYHFLRAVLKSTSNPPRNRWSDPFEMIVHSDDGKHKMILRQNRVGNMERDRAAGWFDNLRGLQYFHAEHQIGKMYQWISRGKSVAAARGAGVSIAPRYLQGEDRLEVNTSRASRKSDVERSSTADAAANLDGFADAVIVHSGPHDRRHPGHTGALYEADLRQMKRVMHAACPRGQQHGGNGGGGAAKCPAFLWRTNVVSAGPYYRCSRLENPWIYRQMDRVAASVLLSTATPWTVVDAASVSEPLHWGLKWSDGIHYGRYSMKRLTLVDRVAAVLWWNTLRGLL